MARYKPSLPPLPHSRPACAVLSIVSFLLLIVIALSSRLSLLPSSFRDISVFRAHSEMASLGGYVSAYSFDLTPSHAAWMGAWPNSTLLTDLSIPGTHDTMTYEIDAPIYRCQNSNLELQLQAGLRYLDIRLRLRTRELHVYHSDEYTGFSFEDVLAVVFAFLDSSPSEVVLMRIKKEGDAADGDETVSFENAFDYVRTKSARSAAGCSRHLHLPPVAGFTRVPALGDARAKVLIFQDFPSDRGTVYGIPWDSNLMVLQDFWELYDRFDLASKWVAIEETLVAAAAAANSSAAAPIYMSHISATGTGELLVPIAAAAGPLNSSVPGMNSVLGEWLADGDAGLLARHGSMRDNKTGVVILDFPGQKLVDAILGRNQLLDKV